MPGRPRSFFVLAKAFKARVPALILRRKTRPDRFPYQRAIIFRATVTPRCNQTYFIILSTFRCNLLPCRSHGGTGFSTTSPHRLLRGWRAYSPQTTRTTSSLERQTTRSSPTLPPWCRLTPFGKREPGSPAGRRSSGCQVAEVFKLRRRCQPQKGPEKTIKWQGLQKVDMTAIRIWGNDRPMI